MKFPLTKNNILEAIAVIFIGAITAYFVYSDFAKERKPSACEINPKSQDCYYETLNNESDPDYQPGAYGLE